MARVLEEAEQPTGPDIEVQLLTSHSLNGARQGLAEADGATRDVPEAPARPGVAEGQQNAVCGRNDHLHREPGDFGVNRLVLVLRKRAPRHGRHPGPN